MHGQLASGREERQEGFRRAHEAREAGFQQAHEAREAGFQQAHEAREAGFQQAREARDAGFRQAREERKEGFARLEKLMLEGFAEFREHFARTDTALLQLAGRVSAVEERSAGTRRLVWGVLGGLALLIAGGLLRPLFDRAIAALLAGG